MALEVNSSEHGLYAEAMSSYYWSTLDRSSAERQAKSQMEKLEDAARPGVVQSRPREFV
jgi:hypothetical protein